MLGLGLSIALVLFTVLPSPAIQVSEVPNPRQLNGGWVSDVADLLSPASESQLNQLISELEAENGAEIAVVTVPNTQPSPTPKAFATELFNAWGIGKVGADNGVLFLVSKDERRTEVETGYGVEGVLPDAKVGEILRHQVTPRFKEGDFDTGILAGTEAIATALRAETFSSTNSAINGAIVTPASGPLSGIIGQIIGGLAMLAAAIAAGLRVLKLRAIRIANPEADTGTALIAANRLTIAPRGHTHWPNDNRSSGWINKILFWLVGEEPLIRNSASTLFLAKQPLNYSKTWWKAFIGLSISLWLVPTALTAMLPLGFLLLFSLNLIALLVFPLWLSLEIRQSSPNTPEDRRTYAGRAVLLFVVVGILCLFTNGLPLPAIGAFAITLCLRRRSRHPYSVLCEACLNAMEALPEREVNSHLNEPQQVAQKLGSTVHQAWRCNNCQPAPVPQPASHHGFDIHLFSQVVDAEEFAHCSTCDVHTVVSESRIESHSTTSSSGTRLITSTCRCCKNVTQKRTKIPRKSSGGSGGSSGSYSGGYSSGGYDSGGGGSSYSGGGGSFGGGSSGGGGGGDSW